MYISKIETSNFKEKNILITGGAGFIGSNIVKFFQKYCPEANLFVFDKFRDEKTFQNGNLQSFGHFKNLDNFNGQIICGDLKSRSDIEKLFDNHFDYIFHQAAISDTTVYDQNIVMETNLNSFKGFIDYASKKKVTLVYASSAATYGMVKAPQRVGIEEPDNPYGFSKLMMDRMSTAYMKNYPDLNIFGLRYFNVYGPGEFFKNRTASVILQIALKLLNNESPLLFKGSENYLRDFIYIDDVVQANILAALSKNSGIYNVGYGKSRSFQDLSDICQEVFNTNIQNKYIENNLASYQSYTKADISSTIDRLGYQPMFSLEDGIKEYASHIVELNNSLKTNIL